MAANIEAPTIGMKRPNIARNAAIHRASGAVAVNRKVTAQATAPQKRNRLLPTRSERKPANKFDGNATIGKAESIIALSTSVMDSSERIKLSNGGTIKRFTCVRM